MCGLYFKDFENVVHVFIWADLEYRKNRAITQYNLPANKAEEEILKSISVERIITIIIVKNGARLKTIYPLKVII